MEKIAKISKNNEKITIELNKNYLLSIMENDEDLPLIITDDEKAIDWLMNYFENLFKDAYFQEIFSNAYTDEAVNWLEGFESEDDLSEEDLWYQKFL